jgi:hypothetical protein
MKIKFTLLFLIAHFFLFSQEYVKTQRGDIPILLSAPHGGKLKPDNLPNRNCIDCVYTEDSYTKEILLLVKQNLETVMKGKISYVYTDLHRRKLDFNRPILEATDSNYILFPYWRQYHSFIKHFSFVNKKSLVIDIHGQAHTEELLEIGSYNDVSKIKMGDFFNTITGSKRAYPANEVSKPSLYFPGGYITKTIYNGEIHFQFELPRSMRFRDREKIANAIANTILSYYNYNFK